MPARCWTVVATVPAHGHALSSFFCKQVLQSLDEDLALVRHLAWMSALHSAQSLSSHSRSWDYRSTRQTRGG